MRLRHAVVRQSLVGLLMLPLSVLPFALYLGRTQEGGLLWAKVETSFAPPEVVPLDPAERDWVRRHAPRYEGRVALLVYHGLGSGSEDAQGDYSLSAERFAEQLVTLRTAGMHPVTARDVALALTGQKELPPNAFMVSFDDGRTDAMLYAEPILHQLQMKATMFAITSAASEPGLYYAPWRKLRQAARSGRWDIQSHSTDSHREHEAADGRRLPVLTSRTAEETERAYDERVHADLVEAARTIADEVGETPLAFAYPFGAHGADRASHGAVDGVVAGAVAATNVVAFHQDGQADWRLATCSDPPLGLRRLEVGNWTGRELLGRIAAAAGLRPDGYTCTDTYHSGAGQRHLRSLPHDVRTAVVAAVADDPDAAPLDLAAIRREWPRLPGVSAGSGDAITDCQVVSIGCEAHTPRPGPVIDELLTDTAGSGDALSSEVPALSPAPVLPIRIVPPVLAAPAAAVAQPTPSASVAPVSPTPRSGGSTGANASQKNPSVPPKPSGAKKNPSNKH